MDRPCWCFGGVVSSVGGHGWARRRTATLMLERGERRQQRLRLWFLWSCRAIADALQSGCGAADADRSFLLSLWRVVCRCRFRATSDKPGCACACRSVRASQGRDQGHISARRFPKRQTEAFQRRTKEALRGREISVRLALGNRPLTGSVAVRVRVRCSRRAREPRFCDILTK